MNRLARIAGLSLVASVAAHGLLLLAAAWLVAVIPPILKDKPKDKPLVSRPPALQELENAEAVPINFVDLIAQLQKEKSQAGKPAKVPPPPPVAVRAAPPPPPAIFVRSREGQPEQAPFTRNTPFISDKDTRASATRAPEAGGDPNLPSQQGRDLPFLSLTEQDFADGGAPEPAAPEAEAPEPPVAPEEPSVAQTPPPAPAPPPADRPPDPALAVKTKNPAAPSPAAPKAPEIALRETPIAPAPPTPGNPRPPRPAPPPRPASASTAAARSKPSPGGRRSLSSVKTRSKGSLAVRGENDEVDAAGTPEGRYKSAIQNAVGPIWNARLAGVSGLAGTGVVEVSFEIDAQGRVSNVRLVQPGTANPILEDACITAITKAKLPPPPDELRKELADPLSGGKLRRRFSFFRL